MLRLAEVYIDIPALRPGTAGAYAFAFLCTALATALRLVIDPYVTGVQYITFYPAVIMVTLVSGFGAGLFCVALSAIAASFFILPPRWSFYVEHLGDVLSVLLFMLASLMIVTFATAMRSAVERYRMVNQELEQSRQELGVVVRELQHRTRNLIAVVGAIAEGTMGTSKTFDDFRLRFRERLGVLGRAQGLLSGLQGSDRVTFDELINTELAAHSVSLRKNGPVTLDGPERIRLRSRTVQPLAMALHELLTNATKYGALKQPNGHLTIRWQKTLGKDRKPWLHLDWKESGVEMPPLHIPQRIGQGRELIEQALRYQFGAQTTFAMEPDGVHCTISLPASEQDVTDASHPSRPQSPVIS